MKLNTNTARKVETHEGGKAWAHMTPAQELRRTVLSCLLWENGFYENGQDIAARILDLVSKVDPQTVSALAIEARTKFNLRHVPLLLAVALCKTASGQPIVRATIDAVIQRADELTEFCAVYAKVNGVDLAGRAKLRLSAQAKKGLAQAFTKFDAYQLGKYNRDGAFKLRDVLFLTCPKPKDAEQSASWKALADGNLATPDTWEVSLSAGADKKATFERLLSENKLGYFALLRNLRNMDQAGVDKTMVRAALQNRMGADKILPFRFIAAARACPQFEPDLDKAMAWAIERLPQLPGRTVVLVDVSGSMDEKLSAKSDLQRIDAAAALASVVHAERLRVFTFSEQLVEVAPRRGMAGVDAVIKSQYHSGTRLGAALQALNTMMHNDPYDRIIVITDEQVHDRIIDPMTGSKAYLINVGTSKNGVGYGRWTHLDGFSENVLRYIAEAEREGFVHTELPPHGDNGGATRLS